MFFDDTRDTKRGGNLLLETHKHYLTFNKYEFSLRFKCIFHLAFHLSNILATSSNACSL